MTSFTVSISGDIDDANVEALLNGLDEITANPANGVVAATYATASETGSLQLPPATPPPPTSAELFAVVEDDAAAIIVDSSTPADVVKLLADLAAYAEATAAKPAEDVPAPAAAPAPADKSTNDAGDAVAL